VLIRVLLLNNLSGYDSKMEVMQMKTLWVKTTIVYIGLIAISLMFATQISARVDPKLAVGIWLFNEGKGDVAKDIAGNANDGALKTGPKWVDGKFGKGLEFDGKSAYVEVAKSDNLDITDLISQIRLPLSHGFTHISMGKAE
jgi:hypothetical protein